MNEELKIIIKAVTDEAKKNIDKVKQELEDVKDTGEEAGKSIDEAMQGMKKGALIAVGAITAVTTAMVALGKSSQEFQKTQARLISGFQAAGSTAQQATQTYKELFGFMGESDTATEAANLLAQLTTNEEELAEWTNILKGVYATFPDSLPVEALAEAANETAKTGVVTGNLADALNWLGVSEDEFNKRLETTNSHAEREALIRSTLNGLYSNAAAIYDRNNQALIAYNQSQAELDIALANATRYVTPLLTEFNKMATVLLTVLKPAFETISSVLIVFLQWITAAIQYIGTFFGLFGEEGASATKEISKNIQTINSVSSGIGSGFSEATKEAEKLKKTTMGFDELNIVSNPNTASSSSGGGSGSGGGGGGSISIPSISGTDFDLPSLDDFNKNLEEVREKVKGILVLVGLVAAGFLAWKIAGFVTEIRGALKLIKAASVEGASLSTQLFGAKAQEKIDGIKGKVKSFAGTIMAVAGAILLAIGYSDAWANGVDWGNMAVMLAGVALAIGGVTLAYGKLAGAMAAVTAGIALIILGVKDFINNGATLQNPILIIGGSIAVAVGLATAGLSVVVAAIIGAITAVAAFTAAILLEKPAIMSVEEAQQALTAAKERAAEAENTYVNAVDAATNAENRLAEAEKAAGITGADLFAQVQAGTLDYANMTDAQKEVYKAYLDNEQKQKDLKAATEELNAAKKAETIASYENQLALAKESGNYDEFKKSVVAAFEAGELSADEARDLIGKSMSEMSDDAQQAFMKDIPNDIKDGLNPSKYETTRKKITDWFKQAWKDIKNVFSKVGEFFSGVWDKVTTIFSKVGKKIGDAVSGAFKNAVNWVLEKAIGIINGFIGAINTAIDVINLIPGVGISKLKLLDVPALATGGIVTGETLARIGEGGKKEAVLPLEQNTGWMDTLADRIAARQNTPSKIVLMLDGKELGWASINSINGITKQTGSLQLAMV